MLVLPRGGCILGPGSGARCPWSWILIHHPGSWVQNQCVTVALQAHDDVVVESNTLLSLKHVMWLLFTNKMSMFLKRMLLWMQWNTLLLFRSRKSPMICIYKHVRAYDCVTMKYDGCIPFNTISNATTPNFRIWCFKIPRGSYPSEGHAAHTSLPRMRWWSPLQPPRSGRQRSPAKWEPKTVAGRWCNLSDWGALVPHLAQIPYNWINVLFCMVN